jgi:alkylation response protein AidB-like acyl-CoA dehydrogenase
MNLEYDLEEQGLLSQFAEVVAGIGPERLRPGDKLWWPRAHQQLTDLAVSICTSLQADPSKWYDLWLDSRPESIYGGTAQIQRDIISEQLLGLPRGRRG